MLPTVRQTDVQERRSLYIVNTCRYRGKFSVESSIRAPSSLYRSLSSLSASEDRFQRSMLEQQIYSHGQDFGSFISRQISTQRQRQRHYQYKASLPWVTWVHLTKKASNCHTVSQA
jgi:hypothetical protein